MGLLMGQYEGRSDAFRPGGLSFENGFCPHGGSCHPCQGLSEAHDTIVSYDEWRKATEGDLAAMRISEGTTGRALTILPWLPELTATPAFMFETSMMLTISDWALNRTGKLHGEFKLFFLDAGNSELSLSLLEHEPAMWDGLKGHFTDHLDAINSDLRSKGLPLLGASGKA